MIRSFNALLLAAMLLLSGTARAEVAQRVALVVGNSGYRHVPALANPANDANLMAATLRRLGFVLVGGGAQIDLDKPAFEAAVRRFNQSISPGAVALFYYSGHGLQVNGANFLVPVGADPQTAADVPVQMVDAGGVLQQMAKAGTGLNVLVLDACRDNPFAAMMQEGARGLQLAQPGGAGAGLGNGLAEMHAPPRSIISFATQPGSVAFDGAAGAKDSPYTTALAQSLLIPGQDVVRAFNRVGLQVERQTKEAQEPWLALSPLDEDVFLAGPPVAGSPPPPPLPAEATAAMMPHAMRNAMPALPAPAPGASAAVPPPCPPPGTTAVRNGTLTVAYFGAEAGSPETCLQSVGGVRQSLLRGVWLANWPGAGRAAVALQHVLAAPVGHSESFEQSADVEGFNFQVTSETWRFTLTNEGSGTVALGGHPRLVTRVRWEERNLAHPYTGRVEIGFDAATGAVLSQNFALVSGGPGWAYDFWSKYGGGLSAVPAFQVTALQ